MAIDTGEFKKGVFIEIDNVPYKILEAQHVKPGKGNAFIRTRIYNLLTGNTIDKTFKSGETVDVPDLERKAMQYLYVDVNAGAQFMDLESFEQLSLPDEFVGDAKNYLIENMEIEILYFNGKPITLDLPTFVRLEVIETDPSHKGDTVTGGSKPAKLQTGLVVAVPGHISRGDFLKIDTRTGEYIEKLK